MDRLLSYARSRQKEMIDMIGEFVEAESPSDDPASVNRFGQIVLGKLHGLGKTRLFPQEHYGRHVRCEFQLPGKRKSGQILALGHSDTVWPLGTIGKMPFRRKAGRLWGPGVFDMKAGLVFLIFAVKALRDLEIPVARKVLLQVNSDEEVGSKTSRPLTEEAARASDFVLVLEPGAGLDGKLKTARKGVGDYTVTVRGKASHAGVDFTGGASAIVELARQIERIAGFTQLERGITVNPGVIAGGTRTNVIAAEARAGVDVRIARLKDEQYIEKCFRSLKPADRRCTIEVTGGLNRPPMERSAGIRKLFGRAAAMAREMGVEIEESSTGGGSDGNFTAALGVPTLDGLGAVGEGAHAANESILVDRIADRTALIAKLLAMP
jgi:glutamate carboxypeptidase